MDKLWQMIVDSWNRINPILFIKAYEQAVILRGGKYHKTLKPGWYWRLSGVDIVITDNVQPAMICIREVNVTTKDGQTVSIAGTCKCKITNISQAKILTNDWQAFLVNAGRKVMSEELYKYTWAEICAGEVAESVGKLLQKEAKLIGLEIWDFGFTDKLIIRGFKLFNA